MLSALGKAQITLLLALLASLVALTSCGSGDSATTAASVSKEEFIRQADKICAKTEKRQLFLVNEFQEKMRAENNSPSEAPSAKAEVELVTFAGLPPIKRQIEEISELPAPQGGAGQVDSYLKALEDGTAAVEKQPASLLGGQSEPFAKASSLAKNIGFKVCSGA